METDKEKDFNIIKNTLPGVKKAPFKLGKTKRQKLEYSLRIR